MPKGREAEARAFYVRLLGLTELQKPPELASRGGAWFQCGTLQLHLGVEAEFRPAKKAHPALRVERLEDLLASLRGAGFRPRMTRPCRRYGVRSPKTLLAIGLSW